MHGAGVIAGIENCEVLGEDKSYYVLQLPMGSMKVMIPTDNVENIGLRDVIPKSCRTSRRKYRAAGTSAFMQTWRR